MSDTPASPPSFDAATLPWTDRPDFESELQRRLDNGQVDEADAEQLRFWHANGYLVVSDRLDDELVQRLLDDYERFWRTRPADVRLLVEGLGETPWPEVPPRDELGHHHYRVQDIQDASQAARDMILHRRVVHALRLIFDETPVAMQSLFFEYGSEQRVHQDFPYVQSQILSHLVGCWMACDEVDDDNGPLFYYPGSHRLPLFDWGGGSLKFDFKDESQVDEFSEHLETEAEKAGLDKVTFHARRGDVFLWHGALAHGGSPVNDTQPTRRSLVVHYSTRTAYPRDRRTPDLDPVLIESNGGILYQLQQPGLLARLTGKLRSLFR